MNNRDGGPAYPSQGFADQNGNVIYPEYGMTLRQYYKAAALHALLSAAALHALLSYDPTELYTPEAVSSLAGQYANAMLAEDEAHEREGK